MRITLSSLNFMYNKLTKIFQKAAYKPSPNLAPTIWSTIITYDKRVTRFRLWVFSFVGLTSMVGLIPAVKELLSDFALSGFNEYFSLIFSSSGSVLSYWKEWVFSLAESMPITSIILTFSLLFICFFSLRHLMRQVGRNQLNFAS